MKPFPKMLTVVLAALVLAALGVAPVAAQTTATQCFGPVTNSVICSYTSSTNTTDGSGGTGSAQTIVNASIGTSLLQAQPVRMQVVGYLSSATPSGSTREWTLSTSWGGTSLTLFSALTVTANLQNTPFVLECDLVQASSSNSLSKELDCKASFVSSGSTTTGTTETSSRQRTAITFSSTQTQAVTVSSTLTSSLGLGVVVQRVAWSQGN